MEEEVLYGRGRIRGGEGGSEGVGVGGGGGAEGGTGGGLEGKERGGRESLGRCRGGEGIPNPLLRTAPSLCSKVENPKARD